MVIEKLCKSCNETKPASEFWKRGNGLRAYCKDCCKEKWTDHYHANPDFKNKKIEQNKKSVLKQAQINQEYILSYLLDKQCSDCYTEDILVLEFDHITEDKIASVSSMIKSSKLEKLKKEINKCEVVCRNCHIIRTQRRSNSYRWRFVQERNKQKQVS